MRFSSWREAGVITEVLGLTMAGAVGFRNVLVHGYIEVDDGKVIDHLEHVDDLRAFVRIASRGVV